MVVFDQGWSLVTVQCLTPLVRTPAGHAYAAAISACAAGGCWERAVALFDEMLEGGVRPDVVSCTALVAALGADGQWQRAERVVAWMLQVSRAGLFVVLSSMGRMVMLQGCHG